MIVLSRFETSDEGTFGRLNVLGLYTGELPWRDNASNVSCIPEGTYPVIWTYSPRFKREMYLLVGTEPRAGIREHPANLMGDASKGYKAQLNGCIAPGERVGWIKGQKAVLLSAPAMRRFEDYMGRKPFMLEIKWNC